MDMYHRRIQDFVRGGGAKALLAPGGGGGGAKALLARASLFGGAIFCGEGGGGQGPLGPPPGSAHVYTGGFHFLNKLPLCEQY